MAKAVALAHDALPAPFEALRMAIVCTCAVALIMAGQPLPF